MILSCLARQNHIACLILNHQTGILNSPSLTCIMNRRQFLRSGVCFAAAGVSTLLLLRIATVQNITHEKWSLRPMGALSYPIPWLYKNGSYNQSPGPGMEPSSVYHFKGKITRCNDFTGIGTDNKGNRISFGAPRGISHLCVGFLVKQRSKRPNRNSYLKYRFISTALIPIRSV